MEKRKKNIAYKLNGFILKASEYKLLKDGQEIYIRPKTLELLLYLVERHGHVVTKNELFDNVWKELIVSESTLSQCIKELRKIFNDDPNNPKYIKTIYRVGFEFVANVEKVEAHHEVIFDSPFKNTEEKEGSIVQTNRAGKQLEHFVNDSKFPNKTFIRVFLLFSVFIFILWLTLSNNKIFSFGERNWVLITDFDNKTKQPDLDLALRTALELELSRSTFVNIVPEGRILDVLHLMKINPNTKVDESTAKEISLRDGNIQALISGSIREVGGVYEISVHIIEPESGTIVSQFNEQTNRTKDILSAIRKIALDVRKNLGESSEKISKTEINLEKVTTPSLNSLKFYSKAMTYINQFQMNKARMLFEQAVKEDSTFAMALVGLGYTNLWLNDLPEAIRYFALAKEHSNEVTDRERYFILDSYYLINLSDMEKSIASYELLVESYPDDFWGHQNLSQCYQVIDDPENYNKHKRECIRLRPNNPFLYSDLALNDLYVNADFKSAYKNFSKVLRLNTHFPFDRVQLSLFFNHWMNNDYASAENELKLFYTKKLKKLLPEFMITCRWYISGYYLFTGRYNEAIEQLNEGLSLAEKWANENYINWAKLDLSLTYLETGDENEFIKRMNDLISNAIGIVRIEALGWLSVYLAYSGKISHIDNLKEEIKNENRPMKFDQVNVHLPNQIVKTKKAFELLIDAELANHNMNKSEALNKFQQVANLISYRQSPYLTSAKARLFFYATKRQAEIYTQLSMYDKAIEKYKLINKYKVFNITQFAVSNSWIKAVESLINLLEQTGKTDEAEKIKKQLPPNEITVAKK